MEIGASDAPASCGSSVLSLCRQARGALGLESTERWTNLALGYVSYDVYMRKFTRNGASRAHHDGDARCLPPRDSAH